jgi:hypothetical protein
MTMSEMASESGTGWGGLLGTTALVLLGTTALVLLGTTALVLLDSSQPTHIVRFW